MTLSGFGSVFVGFHDGHMFHTGGACSMESNSDTVRLGSVFVAFQYGIVFHIGSGF